MTKTQQLKVLPKNAISNFKTKMKTKNKMKYFLKIKKVKAKKIFMMSKKL